MVCTGSLVALPVLWPSLLGTLALLFANAFGAVATAIALTGSLLLGWSGGGFIGVGDPYLFTTLAAVVIGGTSLFGGRGTIVGSVLGAIIVGVFRFGLSLSKVDVLWQDFTVGILIIGFLFNAFAHLLV